MTLKTFLKENLPSFSKVEDTEIVEESEVVNQRLGDIKVSVDGMHDTLKSVKEDTRYIQAMK
jgi:hypothetical protein